MLPFTTEQFLEVFERYNEAVWPSQLVLVGAGLMAVVFAAWKRWWTDLAICLILAGFWFWMGLVYHIGFFSSINSAAVVFGCLSVAQGLLFLYAGPVRKRLSFAIGKNWSTVLGASLLLYAMLIYPLLGLAFGHVYPRQPTFGVPALQRSLPSDCCSGRTSDSRSTCSSSRSGGPPSARQLPSFLACGRISGCSWRVLLEL